MSTRPNYDHSGWTNWSGEVRAQPRRHYRPSTRAELIELARDAEAAVPPVEVKAVGSGWSFSAVAATDGYLVETRAFDRPIEGVVTGEDLFHVQAGITLWALHLCLDSYGRALATVPAASGQTLAGAALTGSHGADAHLPPLADAVLAVHLVGAGGVEHWIEGDRPVADLVALTRRYPRIVVHRDEQLLRAAQVSVGRMGIVYAMVVRTVPRFGLRESRVATTWAAAAALLADPRFLAAHRAVQLVVTPYRRADGARDCSLTVRDELPGPVPDARESGWTVGRTVSSVRLGPFRPGDAVGIAANLLNRCGGAAVTRRFVRAVLTYAQRPRERTGVAFELMTDPPWAYEFCRGTSLEVFFDADRPDVLTMIDEVLLAEIESRAARGQAAVGWVSLRYTGPSRARLAMQRWPHTVAVEVALLRGIDGSTELLRELERRAVGQGGTVHWGQLRSDLTAGDDLGLLR